MDPELRKRILISAGGILFVGAVGYAIYAVFFRAPTGPTPGAPAAEGGVGSLPGAGPALPRAAPTPPPRGREAPGAPSLFAIGGLTLARTIAARAASPALSPDGRAVSYYDPSDSHFYRVGPDGARIALSDKQFYNVEQATWSPNQDRAIIEYPDGSNILFDFQTQQQVTIPKHWEDFAFTADGAEIAGKSIGTDPENRWLIVANPDGSGAIPVEPLGGNADKVLVSWSPTKEVVALAKTGEAIGFGREEIIPLGLHNENFRGLQVEGLGFTSIWSKNGRELIYSVYSQESGYKPELWVVEASGDRMGNNRRRLNVQTWADKCVPAGDTMLLCAVPLTMPDGAGFERSIAESSPDSLYRIDLKTGLRTLIAVPDSKSSITKLMVSADGRSLFFQEAGSTSLRTIAIP